MTAERPERAVLVAVALKGKAAWIAEDQLKELALLAQTAGAEVVESVLQRRDKIDPAFFIGKGKCADLKNIIAETGADLVIFDDDLSPAQMRNLDRTLNRRIIDRTGLILDIFARRACSREAKIEVELAQLKYILPRLTGHWTHLERQVGGIGVRGPGETQLETDRRLVKKRISTLQEKLRQIEKSRALRREKRSKFPVVALVGYTNAGKSTLLNALTHSKVFVEDKLFATLDPAVRSFIDEDRRKIILADTVGFIRKLPHHLVASFRSTLEEVVEADLLLHIVDLSNLLFLEQMEQVMKVLEQIGAADRPVLTVMNKVDLVERDSTLASANNRFPNALFISASRRLGLKQLMETVSENLFRATIEAEITLEPERFSEWKNRFKNVKIKSKEFIGGKVKVHFTGDESIAESLREFAGNDDLTITRLGRVCV